MRVLVTGGSGFVGAHTVTALVAAGHRVRVLARRKARVGAALGPLGTSPDQIEVVEGDLTDAATIPPAMVGMDAVVHAASVFSFDPRQAEALAAVNLAGTRLVLEAALAAGCDPVVHVSSLVALLPASQRTITADSPPGTSDPRIAPYSASKAAQERLVREMQAAGAPVVSVLPGSVWGPHDPHDGESQQFARSIARRQLLLSVRGGVMLVDVRDVAAVLTAVVGRGAGHAPDRFSAGGTWQTMGDLHREVGRVLGRRLVTLQGPAGPAMLLGRVAGRVQRRVSARLPVGTEQVFVTSTFAPCDDRHTREELELVFRPVAETIRDQLIWQQAADRL